MTRVAILAAAALAAILVGAASLDARTAAGLDFGDAPDGAAAGYAAKPDVVGRFPSKTASGGPRHTGGGPRFGAGWTAEPASRQVDRDADDGATLVPRSCATSTLVLPLDLSRVRPGLPVYVNAWFDWNQDGDWADGASGSCGPEWGIQNHRVDAAAGVAVLELRFRGGRVPDDFWWRVQIHVGAPAPHAGGGGQRIATPGETEDRLFSRPRAVVAQRVGYTCAPAAGAIAHGGFQQVNSWLTGTAGRSAAIAKSEATLLGDKEGVQMRRAGRDWTSVIVRSLERHDRRPIAQTVRVQFDVTAAIEGRLVDFTKTCSVTIWHSARIFPPPSRQPVRIAVPSAGVAIDPARPTPESAKCRASFVTTKPTSYGIRFRCDGIDVKSISFSAGSLDERVTGFNPNAGSTCRLELGGTAGRCIYSSRRTKGLLLGFGFATDKPLASNRIHILAGGYSPGGTGTTIVLLQDWFVFPDGRLECRQQIPRADACALA